ncbi:MAG: pentapeptide repeat-containing protein [Anaerolineae bacterium]|nr:pentapeptide repeat-containing protein [Anaerolineae bacterium]
MPNLIKCETNPVLDPYHKAAGQASFTILSIFQNGDYQVDQEYDDGVAPVDEANGLTLTYALFERPDEKAARAYLESQEAVALVERIHAGHGKTLYYNNVVGTLTEDAEAAIQELLDALAALPESKVALWTAGDWVGNTNDEEIGIGALTTDAEIAALVEKLDTDARAENIILAGTEEYLVERRRLARQNLAGADLRSVNLVGASLSGADLSSCDLRGVNLTGADLSGTNLTEARLSGAILCGANLENADLSDADLENADLTGANLENALISGAKVTGTLLADD